MKIIQIMPEFGLAGAETMCENLTYELNKLGHDVLIISMYNYHSEITERMEKKRIKILYLGKMPGWDFSMIDKMKKIFIQEKPDVIHTHRYVMQYAIPAAIGAKIKRRIHTVHSVAKQENIFLARKVNLIFYKFANVTPVALSKNVQKTIAKEYGLNEAQIPIIFNGINLQNCKPKTSYVWQDTINIVHVGRFVKAKNHTALIESFANITELYPNCRLHLIGDGAEKNKIEILVKQKRLQNKVLFWGLQNNVFSFLHNADIFVLPSTYEGMPMTLIEAMGTGLPIVASDVGGVSDMVRNEKTALLIKPNVEGITNALKLLINDLALREKIGENALVASKKFSAYNMARKYVNLYLE